MQIVNFGKSDSFIQVIWFPPEIKMTTMILLIHLYLKFILVLIWNCIVKQFIERKNWTKYT